MSQEKALEELTKYQYSAEIVDGILYINCSPSDEKSIFSIRKLLKSFGYDKTWGIKLLGSTRKTSQLQFIGDTCIED